MVYGITPLQPYGRFKTRLQFVLKKQNDKNNGCDL